MLAAPFSPTIATTGRVARTFTDHDRAAPPQGRPPRRPRGRCEERTVDGAPDTLAVAFTDLENFSAFTAREGDEASCKFLADHERAVGPVVRSRGGRIVKQLGDGLLLTFPSAESGVLAALELLAVDLAPLRLRAGLHYRQVGARVRGDARYAGLRPGPAANRSSGV
jgi:class 3 adenylate cyclase